MGSSVVEVKGVKISVAPAVSSLEESEAVAKAITEVDYS